MQCSAPTATTRVSKHTLYISNAVLDSDHNHTHHKAHPVHKVMQCSACLVRARNLLGALITILVSYWHTAFGARTQNEDIISRYNYSVTINNQAMIRSFSIYKIITVSMVQNPQDFC